MRIELDAIGFATLWLLFQAGFWGIQAWTVFMAYEVNVWWALLTFATPGISWLFWAGVTWQRHGAVNHYTMAIVGIGLLYALQVALGSRYRRRSRSGNSGA